MAEQWQASKFELGEDGVALWTMTEPEIMNPLTPELHNDFDTLVDRVEGNEDIRALIIAGEGRAFSAGGNVKGMATREFNAHGMRNKLISAHQWVERLYNLDCPVIAAVDGLAFGGGFSFCLLADFVLASPKARFCSVFGRIGLIPDLGVLYTLPRIVGMSTAKELMYTARSIDAEEAKEMGIVHAIHSSEALMDEARTFAQRLAKGSKPAMALTKRVVNGAYEMSYRDLVDAEANGQALMFTTDFHKEAVRRFMAKEPRLYDWDQMK
ncbi:MAG: enoyl-CoA hydratase/isomerase family protein [Minwuia sp.]|uniref:enoyl-CoA hydratase/isomerase family protein n=1 Tax=Minwuia sp. TaxID=2493630 RepID=UPI003A87844B